MLDGVLLFINKPPATTKESVLTQNDDPPFKWDDPCDDCTHWL